MPELHLRRVDRKNGWKAAAWGGGIYHTLACLPPLLFFPPLLSPYSPPSLLTWYHLKNSSWWPQSAVLSPVQMAANLWGCQEGQEGAEGEEGEEG